MREADAGESSLAISSPDDTTSHPTIGLVGELELNPDRVLGAIRDERRTPGVERHCVERFPRHRTASQECKSRGRAERQLHVACRIARTAAVSGQ